MPQRAWGLRGQNRGLTLLWCGFGAASVQRVLPPPVAPSHNT